MIHPNTDFLDRLYRTLLPAITLTLVTVAHTMRMTRAAIINLLASPYIEMARLKGLSPARIIIKHALPNAMAPIITVVVINLAYLVVGVVVVEVVVEVVVLRLRVVVLLLLRVVDVILLATLLLLLFILLLLL